MGVQGANIPDPVAVKTQLWSVHVCTTHEIRRILPSGLVSVV